MSVCWVTNDAVSNSWCLLKGVVCNAWIVLIKVDSNVCVVMLLVFTVCC